MSDNLEGWTVVKDDGGSLLLHSPNGHRKRVSTDLSDSYTATLLSEILACPVVHKTKGYAEVQIPLALLDELRNYFLSSRKNPEQTMNHVARPRCDNCIFWKKRVANEYGDYIPGTCIRNPPVPVATTHVLRTGTDPVYGLRSMWSETQSSEVCGEHPNYVKWFEQELDKLSEGNR